MDTHDNVPTLHPVPSQYIPLYQKEEVLLAVMDANLNVLIKDEEQFPNLRKNWVELAKDILLGAPNHLPPLQEVNHKIPIIDEEKQYNYYLPRCPDALKTQLIDKIQNFKSAGWWEETRTAKNLQAKLDRLDKLTGRGKRPGFKAFPVICSFSHPSCIPI